MIDVFWVGALSGINDFSTALAALLIFSKNDIVVPDDFFLETASRSGLGIGNTGAFNSSVTPRFREDDDGLGDSTDCFFGANACSDFDCDSLKDIRINKPTNIDKAKIPHMIIILAFVIVINMLKLYHKNCLSEF